MESIKRLEEEINICMDFNLLKHIITHHFLNFKDPLHSIESKLFHFIQFSLKIISNISTYARLKTRETVYHLVRKKELK